MASQAARARQQETDAAAAAATLQQRCSTLERALAERNDQLRAAAAASAGWRDRALDAEQRAAEAEAGAEAARAEAEAAAAAASAEASARAERQAAALGEVQQRFLSLLATKDATIAGLRRQVDEAAAQLAGLL